MIVVLWRAGLRLQEALALAEHDLDPRRGSVLVRRGKGGRRREVGMDDWAWEQLRPSLAARAELPPGPLFCIIDGRTRGRAWSAAAVRTELRRVSWPASSISGIRRASAAKSLGQRAAPLGRPRLLSEGVVEEPNRTALVDGRLGLEPGGVSGLRAFPQLGRRPAGVAVGAVGRNLVRRAATSDEQHRARSDPGRQSDERG
jgi:hypothetical protein